MGDIPLKFIIILVTPNVDETVSTISICIYDTIFVVIIVLNELGFELLNLSLNCNQDKIEL
jgi:hypothetical protein